MIHRKNASLPAATAFFLRGVALAGSAAVVAAAVAQVEMQNLAIAADGHGLPALRAPSVPPAPRRPKSANGAICQISTVPSRQSGNTVPIQIAVVNRGHHTLNLADHVPPWLNFHGTWCWGPPNMGRTPFCRILRRGLRGIGPLGIMLVPLKPGGKWRFMLPLNLSHIFDLTMPGEYETQIAGLGMISNAIRFRILPPRLARSGPALATLKGSVPEFVTAWGKPHDHLQMAAYWRFNPDGSRVVRVRVLFRVVGHTARSIRLCGNPEVDFAKCKVVGPMFKNVHILAGRFARIANRPAPPSAYGHWLVTQSRAMRASARWKRYRTSPGKIYQYWRPMVVNRRYDLSVPGPYTFSARLAKSQLETGTLTVYSFVQPRGYDRPLYEQYWRHGRNHGQ